jgi:ParB-like chromosome segregation protein Spo0J
MAIKLSSIKANPSNPRIIKDEKFKKLVQSIKEFPGMMALRPIIVDNDNIALGGNMRLKALQELGYKELPDEWVRKASELTDEQKKEFIIKDNVGFGEWDWDVLKTDWDAEQLENWGLEVSDWKQVQEETENEPSGYDQQPQWFLNIRCDSENQCQELYEKFVQQGLDVKIVT